MTLTLTHTSVPAAGVCDPPVLDVILILRLSGLAVDGVDAGVCDPPVLDVILILRLSGLAVDGVDAEVCDPPVLDVILILRLSGQAVDGVDAGVCDPPVLDVILILRLSGQAVDGVDAGVSGETERLADLSPLAPQSPTLLLQLSEVLGAARTARVGPEHRHRAQQLQTEREVRREARSGTRWPGGDYLHIARCVIRGVIFSKWLWVLDCRGAAVRGRQGSYCE